MRKLIRGAPLMFLLAAHAACGGDIDASGAPPTTGGEITASAGAADQGANSGSGPSVAALALVDSQIFKVFAAANAGENAVAGAALARAQALAVKNFADMLSIDHGRLEQDTFALARSERAIPEVSSVSAGLESEFSVLLATLRETADSNFDRVYVQSQVDIQQEMLALLDARLLPEVADAELKALMTSTRSTVATHLADAKDVLSTL